MISAKHGAQTDRRRSAPIDRKVHVREMAERMDCNRSTLYRRMKRDPDFPLPLVDGSRLFWMDSVVKQYLATRPVYQPRKAGAR